MQKKKKIYILNKAEKYLKAEVKQHKQRNPWKECTQRYLWIKL